MNQFQSGSTGVLSSGVTAIGATFAAYKALGYAARLAPKLAIFSGFSITLVSATCLEKKIRQIASGPTLVQRDDVFTLGKIAAITVAGCGLMVLGEFILQCENEYWNGMRVGKYECTPYLSNLGTTALSVLPNQCPVYSSWWDD